MSLLENATADEQVKRSLRELLERGLSALGMPEQASTLPGLREALESAGLPPEFAGVDPSVFFLPVLENPGYLVDSQLDEGTCQRLKSGLNMLRNDAGLGDPAPFYAILLMDGDSLGSQLGEAGKQRPISRALNAFTRGVPERIREHQGFLVYAGGDDVLALLPITRALSCAAVLRDFYIECFGHEARQEGMDIPASLSGAVLFCHVKRPLTGVLQDAHRLLDEIAKDATGRDAIAVRVWQSGGIHLTWAQPWEVAIVGEGAVRELGMARVAERFRQQDEARFTNKFLFRIMALSERLPLLAESSEQRALLGQLVRAELLHSGFGQGRSGTKEEVDELVEALLRQAVPVVRHAERGDVATWPRLPALNTDAFKLVRFLAREGRIER